MNWTVDQKYEKKQNSPLKSREFNVVFTFNIWTRCFTPASPIALANRTVKGVKCSQNRYTEMACKYADSLTSEMKHSQCRVHFQRFCNLRSAIYSNIILCLFLKRKKKIGLKFLKRAQRNHSLTPKNNLIQCSVHFQRFGNIGNTNIANFIT